MDIVINGDMKIFCPEGFSTADRRQFNLIQDGDGLVIRDEERHMIISFGWKQTGMLMRLFSGDAYANMESRIAQAMAAYGYQKDENLSRKIGGSDARGFSYRYIAQDVKMYAESYVLRPGNTVYYLHMYTREAMKDENAKLWADMLSSAAFGALA